MTCPHPEKHRHVSKAAALAQLDSMYRAGKADLGLRPYPCEDHWHIGHRGAGSLKVQLNRALAQGRKASRATRRKKAHR